MRNLMSIVINCDILSNPFFDLDDIRSIDSYISLLTHFKKYCQELHDEREIKREAEKISKRKRKVKKTTFELKKELMEELQYNNDQIEELTFDIETYKDEVEQIQTKINLLAELPQDPEIVDQPKPNKRGKKKKTLNDISNEIVSSVIETNQIGFGFVPQLK